ncbi:hypothetical protein MXD61_06165 [Frankia sp. AgPm24]|uniref:hypothetical protein n=1 Tax=Frankia sp. AgPm24 TaxID=631128 RepID=UPI00200D880F|nr:hypothetical protein [Frankia sp. AgPm24]MCK9921479.1 hypothetical protein [Frankia sp. AgPm24]
MADRKNYDFRSLNIPYKVPLDEIHLPRPVEFPQDGKILSLLRAVDSRHELAYMHILLDRSEAAQLGGFGCRATMIAIRKQDQEILRWGLVAFLTWIPHSDDFRDDLPVMALFGHSAKKLGLSPWREFRRAAKRVPVARGWVRGWLLRLPWERSLKAWRYAESADDDGFCYRQTNVGPMTPEMRDMIESRAPMTPELRAVIEEMEERARKRKRRL